MNKKLNILSVALFLSIYSSVSFADKGWRFFAGMEEDFVHESTISATIGGLGPDSKIGDTGLTYGVELSFNCPTIQPPENKIRQQISVLQYKDGDAKLQSAQINTHYVIEVDPKLWIGGGPGIGFVRTDVNNRTSNMISAQLGASVHYSIDKIFIGGEARYQMTQGDEVGGHSDLGASSWQAMLKVGYNLY